VGQSPRLVARLLPDEALSVHAESDRAFARCDFGLRPDAFDFVRARRRMSPCHGAAVLSAHGMAFTVIFALNDTAENW